MLREYAYTLNPTLITDVLRRFKISIPETFGDLTLVEFRLLSPDSFLWKFIIGGAVYYLYAEDSIESLNDVRSKIIFHTHNVANLKFIEASEDAALELNDDLFTADAT